MGGIGKKIRAQCWPGKKHKTLSERYLKQKKGWGYGTSGKTLALQEQGSAFKLILLKIHK
jgi:hypothetical protein